MSNKHIVKSFDEELNLLNQRILEMGGRAQNQLALAVQALVKRDSNLAADVIEDDARVDEMENQIDEMAVRVLALRQPMADDLRNVTIALKITTDIERVADYAKNVAKRAIALNQSPPAGPVRSIPRMGRMVQEMLNDVLDAFVQRDVPKAIQVWERDAEVDDLYTSLFRELLTYMMEDPRNISPCTHLLFIAKNIERIGDHATNIAESVHFLVRGERLRSDRPKSDDSSFEVITAKDTP